MTKARGCEVYELLAQQEECRRQEKGDDQRGLDDAARDLVLHVYV